MSGTVHARHSHASIPAAKRLRQGPKPCSRAISMASSIERALKSSGTGLLSRPGRHHEAHAVIPEDAA